MPFIPNTPESKAAALGRSDSLNPATTCRGVSVASGKACRRPTGNSPGSTPSSQSSEKPPNPNEQYFCWQHKDQAADFYALRHTPSQKIRRLQGRTSLDTLVEVVIGPSDGANDDEEVVGLVNPSTFSQYGPILVKKDSVRVVRKGKSGGGRPATISELSAANGGRQDQLKRPNHFQHAYNPSQDSTASSFGKPVQIRHETKPSTFKRIFCCVKPETYYTDHKPDSDEFIEPPRKVERPGNSSRPSHHVKFDTAPQAPPAPRMAVKKKAKSAIKDDDSDYESNSDSDSDGSTSSSSYDSSDSASKKKVPSSVPAPELPVSLSRRTRNLLLDEINKPVSEKDEEGYIYVFWLRDGTAAPPNSTDNSSASVSKATPSRMPLKGGPKTEARLNAAVLAGETGNSDKRLLLKIGRANNVQRRLHEWSAQCGYDLSLLRYYPHMSVPWGSQDEDLVAGPLKVPFSHRVERLVHLELKDANFNKPHRCAACERLHREWFSVPATRDGLARVDEAIKRWVKWADDAQRALSGLPAGDNSNKASSSQSSNASSARKDSTPRKRDVARSGSQNSDGYNNRSASKSSGNSSSQRDEQLRARMQKMTINGSRPREYY